MPRFHSAGTFSLLGLVPAATFTILHETIRTDSVCAEDKSFGRLRMETN
jgi:hypothetical protein